MIHITCNMGTRDSPDMYALGPQASGIHIRQIPRVHVTTITSPPVSDAKSFIVILKLLYCTVIILAYIVFKTKILNLKRE